MHSVGSVDQCEIHKSYANYHLYDDVEVNIIRRIMSIEMVFYVISGIIWFVHSDTFTPTTSWWSDTADLVDPRNLTN